MVFSMIPNLLLIFVNFSCLLEKTVYYQDVILDIHTKNVLIFHYLCYLLLFEFCYIYCVFLCNVFLMFFI